MSDLAAEPSAVPRPSEPAAVAPLSILAVVAIALAFIAPVGGVVVGLIARRDVRLTGERGDGLAFAAVLVGATLMLFTAVVPFLFASSTLLTWASSLL